MCGPCLLPAQSLAHLLPFCLQGRPPSFVPTPFLHISNFLPLTPSIPLVTCRPLQRRLPSWLKPCNTASTRCALLLLLGAAASAWLGLLLRGGAASAGWCWDACWLALLSHATWQYPILSLCPKPSPTSHESIPLTCRHCLLTHPPPPPTFHRRWCLWGPAPQPTRRLWRTRQHRGAARATPASGR